MKNSNRKTTVFVGMSGGVDSSVSAAILKDQGYSVVGVYMKNWSGDDFGIQPDCPWEEEMADAEKVCKKLGIKFMSFNFEKEYRERVVKYFFKEYEKGRTPNPDVMCNREIKFDMFLKKSIEEGADIIATGHYAQIKENNGVYELHKGKDANKDQTYFLYTLNQEQLSKSLFPIGHMEKSEVRKLAREYDLPNAEKKDSQGICFIGEIDVREFLRKVIKEKKGKIVDIDTRMEVGNHDGIMFYTIGQRHGLDIGGSEKPYFVVEKDEEMNTIFVAMGAEHPKLFRDSLVLENVHLISGGKEDSLKNVQNLSAAIRYRNKPTQCVFEEGRIVKFKNKVRAIAPGQSLVFYDGEKCLGGGVIKL
ncbi:MAG TPA: tRNA 2-thiouridine(34) synthase MnmA [Candidatus Dojkabacteria bacterium]